MGRTLKVQPLLISSQREQLLANGRRTARGEEIDPPPLVKLFMLDSLGAWLLTELDPAEPIRAFGLCDAGLGSPEFGYVHLVELATLRNRFRPPVERDIHFIADRPFSGYAVVAQATGRIAM